MSVILSSVSKTVDPNLVGVILALEGTLEGFFFLNDQQIFTVM